MGILVEHMLFVPGWSGEYSPFFWDYPDYYHQGLIDAHEWGESVSVVVTYVAPSATIMLYIHHDY